jgi:hypothetical protein
MGRPRPYKAMQLKAAQPASSHRGFLTDFFLYHTPVFVLSSFDPCFSKMIEH